MLLAGYLDTGYKIVLLIHIVAVLIALAPAVAHPVMYELEKRRDDGDVAALGRRMAAASRIYGVALLIAGIVGIGLISMSDDVIAFGDTWIWLSLILWVVLNGVLHGVMIPAERALGAGEEGAQKRIESVGPILVVLALVLLYLMVVKPGGGGI
jgi:uncharacterized membrane protein